MNPVLKYRGGKSREIPRFLQYIPDDFDRYIEPFFGGGAVYFYIEPSCLRSRIERYGTNPSGFLSRFKIARSVSSTSRRAALGFLRVSAM